MTILCAKVELSMKGMYEKPPEAGVLYHNRSRMSKEKTGDVENITTPSAIEIGEE